MGGMTHLPFALAVLAVPAASAFSGKSAEVPANLYWTHPYGHNAGAPCPHLAHPNGDPLGKAPCNCPPVPEHSAGHPTTVACTHKKLRHPGGHDTGKKDPFGNKIMSPCNEWDTEHPNGHPGPNGPCGHWKKAHPNGHPLPNKPCTHPAHPEGHGVVTPCNHPLAMDLTPNNAGVKFFTTDPDIQSAVKAASSKLQNQGINVGIPRKLSVFHREPINGDPNDNKDPFWSHYNPVWHSIQLTKGRPMDDLRATVLHELGHALLGHKAVHIDSDGGPHSLSDANDAGLAMSEGWAHFVALYLSGKASAFKGRDWDAGHLDTGIPFSIKNEFRVACILWDLYDSQADKTSKGAAAYSAPKFTFADLFKVYSPSLATLANGPIIPSLDDFLARLKKNNPAKAHLIDPVRNFNLSPK